MERVLIVGGGIGGLTAAVALQRRGIPAEVFEAVPALEPVGAGIWMPPNAMQVFERLGMDEAVAARGLGLDRVVVRDAAQGPLHVLDLEPVRHAYGHTITSMHRARLQQALAEHVEADTLHLGKRCTGVAELSDDRLVVQFDDGSEEVGDVVVGADGIHSTVRKTLFPDVALRYAGQTCYRGIADVRLTGRDARTCEEVWGGAVRFGYSALGRRDVYWFAPMTAPAGRPAPPSPAAALRRQYADFPDPIPEILHHTPDADIIRTDLYDIAPLKTWSRGGVVLLGDAAHAMTPNLGQGGAQSVEDAFVLATVLAAQRNNVRQAIERYERLRIPKVRRLVRTARWYGQVAHVEHRWLRRARNGILRSIPERVHRKQVEDLYALGYTKSG
jgi:2-polyprenyl-6-methoxyphenol hydroxylase-like FAD-dependent oxidoreductase